MAERLESRLLLSADSWVVPTGIDPTITISTSCDESGHTYVATSQDHDTRDIWLGKYDSEGVLQWTVDVQQPEAQVSWNVTASDNGVYIAGYFYGTANFDPLGSPSGLLHSVDGTQDAYLAKYSSNGEFLWVQHWGGPYGDSLSDVDVIGDDAYISANLGTKRFDSDTLVAKINGADGTVAWSKTMGDGGGASIATWTSDEGPARIYVAIEDRQDHGYVMELTETLDGNDATFGWQTYFSTGGLVRGLAVGEEHIGGAVAPTVYAVHTNHTNPDQVELAIAKFDSAGMEVWTRGIPVKLMGGGPGLIVETNTVYLYGAFEGQADFDGDDPIAPLIASGEVDGYLGRFDAADGHLLTVQRMGGSQSDSLVGLDTDSQFLYAGLSTTSVDADYPIGLQGQLSAFVPSSLANEALVMKLDVQAPIVNIASPAPHTTVDEGTAVTLSATTSSGTITWYENNQPIATGESVNLTLTAGSHQISAIATDAVGRIGMSGIVVNVVSYVNNPPVAGDDSYTTSQDEVLNLIAPGVLSNDSDPDDDTISAVPSTETTQYGGSVVLNGDGSFTYTPPTGFLGTDTFTYTVTDGALTAQGTVSITISEPVTESAMYVYDIRFESRAGGKFWCAVFEIRCDSNGSGTGDAADAPVAGAAITVTFAGRTYSGTTGSDGIFRTDNIKDLGGGSHVAEVQSLALLDYFWDLDMGYDGDQDEDGLPDKILTL